MKKLIVSCWVVILMTALFLGRMMFTSMAKEENKGPVPYYKSIRIQEGDSLWGIAGQYKEGSTMSTGEYVIRLKKMNGLTKDTIHAGQYLTVVYFE